MDYNMDLQILHKGITVMPFLPKLLAKSYKNPPPLIFAIYLMAVKKLRPNIFYLKCVDDGYFEDLLSKNTYKTEFIGDFKSCAILTVNSLAALSAANQSWIKIGNHFGDVASNSEADIQCASQTASKPNERCDNYYRIQCYAVSSIVKDFVLYVTNEKYFNIMQHLNVPITIGPSYEVIVENVKEDIMPALAEQVSVAPIYDGIDYDSETMQTIVNVFFETPKLLKINEVFQINMAKITPILTKNSCYFNRDRRYFKVIHLSGKLQKNLSVGYYVSSKYSNINVVLQNHSHYPPVYSKYVALRNKLGYEINACPAGLDKYYIKLKGFIEIFLNEKNTQVRPMILLTGLRGTGKKTVLSCVAASLGLKLKRIDCFHCIGLQTSALDTQLRSLTTDLKKMAPCILVMENIELLGRNEEYKESASVVDLFQKHIHHLFTGKFKHPVIIVATSNQRTPECVPSIRRMFIQTMSFEPMKKENAHALLTWLVHEGGMTCFPKVLIQMSERVSGYHFADLSKLIRLSQKYQREDPSITEESAHLLKAEHLEKAILDLDALHSDSIGSVKIPSVHWDDVGGLENLKEEITLALNFPVSHPELMSTGLRVSGFLFYGPPGTGKTLMAKAVATEFSYNFLSVKGPELINMYVGQSEKNVREVFQTARDAAPCIIFFDELDSLAPNRSQDSNEATNKIVSQLLTEMDGLHSNKGVFIIGATNRPDLVDPALLRPGRFDKMFYVGVCDSNKSKLSVITALTRKFTLGEDVDLKRIVEEFPASVTGADIYSVCSNAWLQAAQRHIEVLNKGTKLPIKVTMDDFRDSLSNFVPSLTPDIVQYYDKFRNRE